MPARIDPFVDVLLREHGDQLRSEEHTSELQSRLHLVCRLLLEKKKKGRFHALARGSYFGGFGSAKPGFCDGCTEPCGGKSLFVAELDYSLYHVDLLVGVCIAFA